MKNTFVLSNCVQTEEALDNGITHSACLCVYPLAYYVCRLQRANNTIRSDYLNSNGLQGVFLYICR